MECAGLPKSIYLCIEFKRLEYDNSKQKMDATNGISCQCCFGGIV